MEYLQFGFAAVFCIILYADQRTTIKAMTKAMTQLALGIEKVLNNVCTKKAD